MCDNSGVMVSFFGRALRAGGLVVLALALSCGSPPPTPAPDIEATVEAAVRAALPTPAATSAPDIPATVDAGIRATLAAAPTATPLPTPMPTRDSPAYCYSPTDGDAAAATDADSQHRSNG